MLKLIAFKRKDEKNKSIRDAGLIPAIVYGNTAFVKEPINIKFKKLDCEKLLKQAGQHTLVDLLIDDAKEPLKVIIKDVQREFVSGAVSHADFYCINEKEEIVTNVPIEYIGESLAVKNLGGILVRHADFVKIKCLPGKLMSKVELDIAGLQTLESSLHFRDLNLPSDIKLVTDANKLIVNITRAKKVVSKKEEVAKPKDNKEEKSSSEKESGEKKGDKGKK